ncbi:MAG: T9SS type A sorting domain-containing protein [Bacteroidia bacterium]|nr:T9SS type A sorting domain-containing protein [Bacteroidia bacterium]
MSKVVSWFSVVCCLCFLTGNAQVLTIKVLFLGNSYTYSNNLPQLIRDLAQANGDTLYFDSNCPGGYTLNNHFNDATSIAKIYSDAWDFVVIQAQSQEPSLSPVQVNITTTPYAMKIDSVIHANDSCTRPVFFETWGRKNGDAINCGAYPPVCTYTGMQDRLRSSYKLFADTCEGLMSPVGESWRKSIALNPTLNLFQGDESHPALEGSYLAACVFYEVLFGKSVMSNSFTGGLNAVTATFLQQVAHDVVNDSLSVWNIGLFDPCGLLSNTPNPGNDTGIRIYPNPATDMLVLRGVGACTYRILDLSGRVLFEGATAGGSVFVNDLEGGMYILEVKQGDDIFLSKFNKQ